MKVATKYYLQYVFFIVLFLGAIQPSYAVELRELRVESGVEKSAVGLDKVNAWEKVHLTRPILSKDVVFLKKFSEILDNLDLDVHIFKGEIKITGGVPGAYSFKVSGVHHKDALDGVTARIKAGTQTAPNAKGYYKGKVEMYHPDNVNNGGWKTKGDESTFFPDSWSKQTVQEEIAIAFKNKQRIAGNKYQGTMSDGTTLHMFLDGEKITSAFPVIG